MEISCAAEFPDIPRRVSGYNLNQLLPENGFHVARALVGSEGTCVTVLEATCRLVQSPPERVLLAIAYSDVYECADHVPEIMAHDPIGLEGFDDLRGAITTAAKGMNLEGLCAACRRAAAGCWPSSARTLSAKRNPGSGFDGDALQKSSRPPSMRLMTDSREAKRVWEVRESSLGVASNVPGEPMRWEGWEDCAVAPEKLGALSARIQQAPQGSRIFAGFLRSLWPRLRARAHGFRFPNAKPAFGPTANLWKKRRIWS